MFLSKMQSRVCPSIFVLIILGFLGFVFGPTAALAQGGQSANGSRTQLSEEEADAIAVELNRLFLDARKAKERCDKELYRELVRLIAEKGRHATASMEAHADLIQQMSLTLSEISEEFRRHLPSGVGGAEIADLAAGEAIGIGLSVAEAAPVVGTAINAVKTLKGLAEKEGAIRDIADIGQRLQEQYRQILEVLISFHRWKTLADKATHDLESLALMEFNCPRPGDDAVARDEPSSPSDWQQVAKGDLVDEDTGAALEGGTITIDPADGDDMGTPGDRELKPGDRVIITAPCHEKRVYVVGIDDVPDKLSLRRKPIRLMMDCGLSDEEIRDKARQYLEENGVNADLDGMSINRDEPQEVPDPKGTGAFVTRCEVLIPSYDMAASGGGCPDLVPSSGVTPGGAGPGDSSGGGPDDKADGPGDGVEAEQPREGQGLSDPFYNQSGSWGQPYDDQWALKATGFVFDDSGRGLWPERAEPTVVAVLDTGIDRYHPELIGAVWLNSGEVPGNGKDDDLNGYVDDYYGWNFVDGNADTMDNNGHGTFVAGIIAAWNDNGTGIAGVNPWARIMPVKVTDFNNKGGSFDIARGIRYAVDNGARVINISIGGEGRSPVEEGAVRYALSKGVVVVVAAGNKGVNTSGFFPAGLPGVITVSSTDMRGSRVGFSNWGGQVDIAAPGVDVLSLRARKTDFIMFEKEGYEKGLAVVGGDRRYYRTSGSSFSAPFVSGVASLILSVRPGLSGEEVRRMVLYSARDIDVPGRDQYTGHGLLDAGAALVADPSFYLDAAISGVKARRTSEGVFIQVLGTADGDRLHSAWVEVGAGKEPSKWQKVTKPLKQGVRGGVVGEIPSGALKGSKQWVVRLVAEHGNGRKAEARYILNLR